MVCVYQRYLCKREMDIKGNYTLLIAVGLSITVFAVTLTLRCIHKCGLYGFLSLHEDLCLPLLGCPEVTLEVLSFTEDDQGRAHRPADGIDGKWVGHQEKVEVEFAGCRVVLGRGLADLDANDIFKKEFADLEKGK